MKTMSALCAAPFSNLNSDKRWEHFLFQSEAFIRLGELLIQKAAQCVPEEPESKSNLESTYSLFIQAKEALRDNYDEVEAEYPHPSRQIEFTLNFHANQIMVNEAKIGEAVKDLFF